MKLPEGWTSRLVSDFISHFDAGVSVNGDDTPALENEYGVLKVSAVTEGVFREKENKRIEGIELGRAAVHPKTDRIVMSRANSPELVGACAYLDRDYPNRFLSDKLWQFEPHQTATFHMRWLHQLLSSPEYRRKLSSLATGTSMSMKNIPQESVFKLVLPAPPLPEQCAIADTLSTWDTAIETMEKLIAAKEKRFTSLIHRSITSSCACKDSRKVMVASILSESRIPGSTGDQAQKLTVKLYGKGVVPKSDTRQGSTSTQYYIRRAGQFIYSKLDFLNGAFGIIPNELDGYESTLDLPAFDVSADASPDWLLYFFTRPEYYENQLELARGQRIARRVNPPDFLASTIDLPPMSTQLEAVAILNQARTELALLRKQLDLLKRQKRGLMQKLLSGAWRVNLSQEAA